MALALVLAAPGKMPVRGRMHRPEDVLELKPDEVGPMVRHLAGPTAEELSGRAGRRRELAALDPPTRLGPEELAPPLEVLAPAHQGLFQGHGGTNTPTVPTIPTVPLN